MARGERQADGNRGGVGTMTRPGPRQRPPQAPEAPADPRRGRPPRPAPPQRPVTGPRPAPPAGAAGRAAPPATAAPARPRTGAPWRVAPARRGPDLQPGSGTAPQAPRERPAQAARAALSGSHRMPFVLLLCGLLGGALVSALVISTTLAEGSFQINRLQDSTSSLARQRQTLEEQVAQAQSAQVIEQRAGQLGMRRPNELLFVNLKSGKTTNDGPTWVGALNAPGYAP